MTDNRIDEENGAQPPPSPVRFPVPARRPQVEEENRATEAVLDILEALAPLQADRVLSRVISHTKERFAMLQQKG